MKIVFAVKLFPGLYETFVLRQALHFQASVTCEVFMPDLYQQYGIDTDVTAVGKRVLPSLMNRLAPSSTRYRDLWNRRQVARARAHLTRVEPDAVVAHFGPNAIKIAELCTELSIPLFVHLHGYDVSVLIDNREYREHLLRTIGASAGTIVVSDAMRDRVVSLGVDASNVAVIPCGVDVESFPAERSYSQDNCSFLAVGRLVQKKAPLLTLEAFERCADHVDNIDLTVIGGGDLAEQLEQCVANSRHRDRIRLRGPQPYDEVRKSLLGSDVFVQHSVTAQNGDTEGWPVAIAEAAAASLPIVSTRHAGIPMQVVEGETGFLVDEGDVDGMADRMQTLAKDRELRVRLGAAARTHIEKSGSLTGSLKRLGDFISGRLG